MLNCYNDIFTQNQIRYLNQSSNDPSTINLSNDVSEIFQQTEVPLKLENKIPLLNTSEKILSLYKVDGSSIGKKLDG